MNTALAQRAKLLQEENDELYELLKSSETGKLKEEVRGLRRAVNRLETALRGVYDYNNKDRNFNTDTFLLHVHRISPSHSVAFVSLVCLNGSRALKYVPETN